jgi:ABC-2 type transport system permease protein
VQTAEVLTGVRKGYVMRNIWLVVKHDVGATLRQRSFWILTFVMPVLLMGMNAYTLLQGSGALATPSGAAGEQGQPASPANLPTIGLVDEAGLITQVPPGFPVDQLVHFPDQAAARTALEAGDIAQYVDIPADYMASGKVTVYARNFQLLQTGDSQGLAFSGGNEWAIQDLIDYNLTSNAQLVQTLRNPTPSTLTAPHVLQPPSGAGTENRAMAQVVASLMPYVYYFLLMMGSNYLLRSVVAEKENRTAEVLLLSLNPRELMVGKIGAMSVVTMVQVVIWVGGGILILNQGAALMQVASFAFPPAFLLWAMLFLVLGFLLFASVMAAAGAISPNAREGNQVIWLLILPLMPTLMFGSTFLEAPNGTLALVLSLFPFSAPAAMVTRLAVASVPLWQVLVSLAGLALTTCLFVTLSARFFQARNLLSQESFNWRRLATGWRR